MSPDVIHWMHRVILYWYIFGAEIFLFSLAPIKTIFSWLLSFHCNTACVIKSNIAYYSDVTSRQWMTKGHHACFRLMESVRQDTAKTNWQSRRCTASVMCTCLWMKHAVNLTTSTIPVNETLPVCTTNSHLFKTRHFWFPTNELSGAVMTTLFDNRIIYRQTFPRNVKLLEVIMHRANEWPDL